jgi:23S rRNA (uracil1939-C5)-methyltransferase
LELTIEKLVYGGEGLARTTSPAKAAPSVEAVVSPAAAGSGEAGVDERTRSKAIFVPYVLPMERVEATIVEERPGFSRARLDGVIAPSPSRTAPPCPYFGKCGGCHYQHASYDEQLRLKSEILRETLRRTAKLDLSIEIQTHPSPPLHYRNRTRFHVRTRPELAIGYFRQGSHELLPVRECPISSPLINRALQAMWSLGQAGGMPQEIAEVELFANETDKELLLEFYLRAGSAAEKAVSEIAHELPKDMPQIQSIVSFEPAQPRYRIRVVYF